MVFGFTKINIKGFLLAAAAENPDTGNFIFLNILVIRVDQQRLDIVFVQPRYAGPLHAEGWVHDRAQFFGYAANRKNYITGQGAGHPVALIDRLLDVIRHQGDIHRDRGTVALHSAVGLNVFYIHFVSDIGGPNFVHALLYGRPDILGCGFGNIADFTGSHNRISHADIDLTVNRQRLPIHLTA